MRCCHRFPGGIPHLGVGSHVLLTRPPLPAVLRPQDVRLACVRHAASVYPEPGSNSPSSLYENLSSEVLTFCVMTSLVTLTGSNVTNWFLTTLQLFKFLPMHPHLARLRLSQAHGDITTPFAPCQEVFGKFFGKLQKLGFLKETRIPFSPVFRVYQ